ncbi:MAG: HEPN domain-containing protein [Candidatus Thiodiazotropha sp. (ex Epidulcina cf. delphinae)]|nr:HEPN domain-containing protein [Candidatus Thiodiazotropha sp. (ex Epidulcina cf. delphinae)]
MEHSYKDTRGPSTWYKMKRRPKHLPLRKQQVLKNIVQAICARHVVDMIILFGSHARGDWVEDEYEEDHITYEYRSDYDILIITADKAAERDVAYDIDLKHDLEPGGRGTRVNYIAHTIHHVNQMLAERRFFFMDIQKEGYLLYDSGRYKLARPPRRLPPDVMLRHAEEYFTEWIESADGFLDSARYNQSKGRPKIAAFDLHQAAERYITCLLLVHTGYRPKEHDMDKLIRQATGFDPRFSETFLLHIDEEKHLFDLLRRAYVDARYSKSYRITEGELNAIAERIEGMKKTTKEVCEEKIETLRRVI